MRDIFFLASNVLKFSIQAKVFAQKKRLNKQLPCRLQFRLGILPSLALTATQTKWALDIIAEQDSGAVLENGIIFNHGTKILLAETFINVDFLVPFPRLEMDLRAELRTYIDKLGQLWTSPSWQCHLDYSSGFKKNDSTFDIDWLLHQVENGVTLAEQELIALRNYTSAFLNSESSHSAKSSRPPRAAPLAMMALASVGLFGSCIALGSGSCGITGIFESCHDRAKTNAANNEKPADFTEALTEDNFKL